MKQLIQTAAITTALLVQKSLGNFGNPDVRPKEFFDPQTIEGYRSKVRTKKKPQMKPSARGTHRRSYLCTR